MIAGLDEIARGHAEHVAEQDVVEMLVGLDLGEEHETEAEHAGEHDAHHRVLLHAAVLLEVAGRQRAAEPGREGADRQRQAEHKGRARCPAAPRARWRRPSATSP